ncbi:hypothetical protein HU200_038308 [Digitaria exilis]|uniref:Uncharacterized protein n=1 Tax=Digitaria exilis TaxID=1010633 RepID=A0A835BAB0_9POAL|nr:hypothetical protein HU200_038308 [Digitaria exilis]
MEEHKRRAVLRLVKRARRPLGEFVAAVEAAADELLDAYDNLEGRWPRGGPAPLRGGRPGPRCGQRRGPWARRLSDGLRRSERRGRRWLFWEEKLPERLETRARHEEVVLVFGSSWAEGAVGGVE